MAELEYARLDNGSIVHIEELSRLVPNQRPVLWCPRCGIEVFARMGTSNAHHFAHIVSDSKCTGLITPGLRALKKKGRGPVAKESIEHLAAKGHIAALLVLSRKTKAPVVLRMPCTACGRLFSESLELTTDDQVAFEPLGPDGLRGDVGVLRGGQLFALFEVLVMHAVPWEKWQKLERLRAYEVVAHDLARKRKVERMVLPVAARAGLAQCGCSTSTPTGAVPPQRGESDTAHREVLRESRSQLTPPPRFRPDPPLLWWLNQFGFLHSLRLNLKALPVVTAFLAEFIVNGQRVYWGYALVIEGHEFVLRRFVHESSAQHPAVDGLDDGSELKRWRVANAHFVESTLRAASEEAFNDLAGMALDGAGFQLVAVHCVDPAELATRDLSDGNDWRDARRCRLPPYRRHVLLRTIEGKRDPPRTMTQRRFR